LPLAATTASQTIEAASRAGAGVSVGADRDVFGGGAPLVPTAGALPGADPEYFSQEPFEFVQTRARRAAE
jgi:hypothetical protein